MPFAFFVFLPYTLEMVLYIIYIIYKNCGITRELPLRLARDIFPVRPSPSKTTNGIMALYVEYFLWSIVFPYGASFFFCAASGVHFNIWKKLKIIGGKYCFVPLFFVPLQTHVNGT